MSWKYWEPKIADAIFETFFSLKNFSANVRARAMNECRDCWRITVKHGMKKMKLCTFHASQYHNAWDEIFADAAQRVSSWMGRRLFTVREIEELVRPIRGREAARVACPHFDTMLSPYLALQLSGAALFSEDTFGEYRHITMYTELRTAVLRLRTWDLKEHSVRCSHCRRQQRWRHIWARLSRGKLGHIPSELNRPIADAGLHACSLACANAIQDRAERVGWWIARQQYRDVVKKLREEIA